MGMQPGDLPADQVGPWMRRWQRVQGSIRRIGLFAAGVLAAALGMLLYNSFYPAPQPLSTKEMNEVVLQAMASATPAPAYSSQVYQVIQPSLVLIQVKGTDSHGDAANGLGSGVVISAAGDILTALHVVENASEITLTFADGSQTGGVVVAEQPENDIAVVQPTEMPPFIFPAVLGNPNAMRIGDEAYAVGNPFGLYGSMSAGVISGFNRTFQAESGNGEIEGLIQIDSAVNPGNSGGPLLNRYGQVIGIVVGILNPTEGEFFIGIGFAVPINVAGGAAGAPQY
ncbi:MAG TPA: trypsin-like peptidase domain-containing protein [Anaerolineaceae bacterium]